MKHELMDIILNLATYHLISVLLDLPDNLRVYFDQLLFVFSMF